MPTSKSKTMHDPTTANKFNEIVTITNENNYTNNWAFFFFFFLVKNMPYTELYFCYGFFYFLLLLLHVQYRIMHFFRIFNLIRHFRVTQTMCTYLEYGLFIFRHSSMIEVKQHSANGFSIEMVFAFRLKRVCTRVFYYITTMCSLNQWIGAWECDMYQRVFFPENYRTCVQFYIFHAEINFVEKVQK